MIWHHALIFNPNLLIPSIILILFKGSFSSKSNDECISAVSLHEVANAQSTINTGNIVDTFIITLGESFLLKSPISDSRDIYNE